MWGGTRLGTNAVSAWEKVDSKKNNFLLLLKLHLDEISPYGPVEVLPLLDHLLLLQDVDEREGGRHHVLVLLLLALQAAPLHWCVQNVAAFDSLMATWLGWTWLQ